MSRSKTTTPIVCLFHKFSVCPLILEFICWVSINNTNISTQKVTLNIYIYILWHFNCKVSSLPSFWSENKIIFMIQPSWLHLIMHAWCIRLNDIHFQTMFAISVFELTENQKGQSNWIGWLLILANSNLLFPRTKSHCLTEKLQTRHRMKIWSRHGAHHKA